MILIEVVILIGSILIGLFYQTTKCLDYIYDSVKLIIFSTLLIDYPWMVIGLEGYVWFKELQQTKEAIQQKEPEQQQQVPPQIILNGQKEGITAASNEFIQQAVEAVQIFDYITGESQYALIQKADKSLLTQLGVTLKNTVLLEKGRQEAQSSQQSKLISQIDHQKRPAINNISIKYEDSHEFQKNQKKPHVSIPFKIGDFDKQMGEIVQAEIMSNAYSEQPPIVQETKYDYEKILIAILFAGGLPLINNIFFRIINALLFGVIIHEAVYREDILTMSHLTLIILTILASGGMYILALFFNYQLLIIGALIWSFSKVNQNLALLILPIPTLLMFIGI